MEETKKKSRSEGTEVEGRENRREEKEDKRMRNKGKREGEERVYGGTGLRWKERGGRMSSKRH